MIIFIGTPDAGAVPLATATGPQRAGYGVANEMIDRPAVTKRTLDGPPLRSLPPDTVKAPFAAPTRRLMPVTVICLELL